MKTLTWQKPGQQNVAQELIKIIINYVAELRKITYLPKKTLYKKQSSFPILCWLWENILLFSSISPNLSVHYCVQFLPIRKMKKYNAGLPSVGFNKSEVLPIRLKPSFTILLETVLLYSLKLPILFSTIEFHNIPYHFTPSPLLS